MENKLVELLDKESSFAYGFLLYEDYEKILINNLDDQGRFDGYTLISKDLVQINEKSDFLKKLKIYNEYWKSISIGKSDSEVFKNEPDFYNIIKYAKDNKKIINIGKNLDYYELICGYVRESDENYAIIDAVDQNSGEIYDEFEIDIKKIKYIEVESIDNILLNFVNKQ